MLEIAVCLCLCKNTVLNDIVLVRESKITLNKKANKSFWYQLICLKDAESIGCETRKPETDGSAPQEVAWPSFS